jgi:hypothetical protein
MRYLLLFLALIVFSIAFYKGYVEPMQDIRCETYSRGRCL